MGASKTDFYTDNQNELAILAKALGHPARIAIIEYILKVNSCICGDIVNELPLAQPTVSQHLKELKNAGLIKGSVEICFRCSHSNIFILQYYDTVLDKKRKRKIIFFSSRFFFRYAGRRVSYNVPPLRVSCEVRNRLFSTKITFLAKRERELTTKFAIARNGC